MIQKIKINYEKASETWGGVHAGYWVSAREVDNLQDENGDCEITLIPVGSGYEIDYIKKI